MENLTDALRTDPVFLKAAGKFKQDPDTYWKTLSPQAKSMHVSRMASSPPALETKPAPKSMEEMDYEDFLNLSKEQGGVPAGAEFPALNSAMETGEDLKAIDTELQRRQTESMAAIDEGLLTENAQAGDPASMTELQRRIKGRETAPSQIGQNPPIEGILSGTVGYQPPTRDPNDPRGPAQIPPPVLSDRMNDPRGVHQIPMPSGSPVLSNPDLMDPRGPHQIPQNPTMPVLTNTTKPDGSGGGVLSKTVGEGPQRNNGNARGSNMSFNKIGSGEDRTAYANTPTGEMLMRVGGKIAAGSVNGYNSAMNDGVQEYGVIKDGDRARDTEAYLEQVRQQEVADEAAADLAGGTPVGPPEAVYQQAALTALDQVQSFLDADGPLNPFDNVTGLLGSGLRLVPGTPAHNTMQAVKTVEAAVGFDRLQYMRDNSPTGGALGQVSNIELDLLKTSLANLNQSQGKKQFQDNLKAVRKHYAASVKAVEAQRQRYYEMKGGKPAPAASGSLSEADLEYLK